jgi:hypothetical protein
METESHDGVAKSSRLVVAPFWRRIMVIAIASRVDSEVLPSICFHVLCMMTGA